MAAPFRIEHKYASKVREGEGFRDYLERLIKMIPGEVVGLYLIGSGLIPQTQATGSAIWAGICLILVIVVRIYGTADPEEEKPSQPFPVFVSAVAFVIWVYTLGGPFDKFGLHVPYIGSLAVLLWSFVIPIFYKGDTRS